VIRSRAIARTLCLAGLPVLCLFLSGSGLSSTVSSVISLPLSSRQAGMGGLGMGGDDPGAAWENPAAPAQPGGGRVVLTAGGGSLFAGDRQLLVIGGSGRLGERSTLSAILLSSGQSFDELDIHGDPMGQKISEDTLVGAIVGSFRVGDRWAVGLSVRGLYDELAGAGTSWVGADAGAKAWWGKMQAGVSVRNLGPGIRRNADVPADSLPAEIRASFIAQPIPSLLAGIGYVSILGRSDQLEVGAEWRPAAALALRGGLEGFLDADIQPSLGLSVAVRQFTLDYAFVAHPAGAGHRLGVTASWGRGGDGVR